MSDRNLQPVDAPALLVGQPSFAELGLHARTVSVAKHLNWYWPTPVQAEVIPMALAGKDVVAVAPTGTGKTGAYGLPLHSLFETERPMLDPARPWAVVLVPTRELAAQVTRVLRSIFREGEELIADVVGGVGFSEQRSSLSAGVAILVATPGRCEDLAQRGDLQLEDVRHWVLDEMDRMLDFGFRAVVRRLLKRAGEDQQRQLLLFSATEGSMKGMLRELGVRHPERVSIVHEHQVPPSLVEAVYGVTESRKLDLLEAMMKSWRPRRTLVFLARRDEVDAAVKKLNAGGVPSLGLHADHCMTSRREAMDRFSAGKHTVLVATDVAGRGVDVRGVELVVHMSVPPTVEEYVHRCGRTARAGAEGRAVILASKDDLRDVERLERKLGRRLPRRILPGFAYGRMPSSVGKIRVSMTGRAMGRSLPMRRVKRDKEGGGK